MRIRTLAAAVLAAAAVALGGCAADPAPEHTASADGAFTGELRIAAAASLQGAFDEVIDAFTAKFTGVKVIPTYDGSSTLATQIENGAKVDVFASADLANMTRVKSLVAEPVEFARNTLVVIVPKGDPGDIGSLDDLADPTAKIVLCAPEVPCGAAAERLLDAQQVTVRPVSQEQNVTAVLTKVRAGEADAGLVYATDAATADDIEFFVPQGAADVVNTYPIAALAGSRNTDAAHAFVDFVTGAEGLRILAAHGFEGP